MKKILFTLLLFTGYLQAQTYPVNPTKFGKISLNTNGVSTSTSKINTQEADGQINYIDAANLPIPTSVINAIKQKADLSTGLLKNGLISINADPTKFNISAGIGIVSNFTDPGNPVSTIINFPAFTAVTPTYLTTGNITYIAINSTPAVIMQASPFTPNQRRDLIVLGAVVHSNLTNINVVNNISAPSNAIGNQLHDFIEAVGALNLTGNKYSANGANLALNKSAGTIFKFGVNFANDWKNPHEISQSSETALTFRYRTQNGTEGTDRINLNPALYDLNNVLTTVPNNKFTIQTVTIFQTGLTRIQYGQNFYDNLSDARNAIFTRNYNVETNIRENGVTRAYIIVKNNATSLQNSTDAEIIEAQKFGGIASGGVSLTFANIVTALGYTPANDADVIKTTGDQTKTGNLDFAYSGPNPTNAPLSIKNYGGLSGANNSIPVELIKLSYAGLYSMNYKYQPDAFGVAYVPYDLTFPMHSFEAGREGMSVHGMAENSPPGSSDNNIDDRMIWKAGARGVRTVAPDALVSESGSWIQNFTGVYAESLNDPLKWSSGASNTTPFEYYRKQAGVDTPSFLYQNTASNIHPINSVFRKSRGTLVSPTATLAGDNIYRVKGQVFDGSIFRDAAYIEFKALSNTTNTNSAGKIVFGGTKTGSTTMSEWVTLDNGDMLLNGKLRANEFDTVVNDGNDITGRFLATSSGVFVSATYNTTGSFKPLIFQTSDIERFAISANGDSTFYYPVSAPTASPGTNTTQVATTAFVANADAGNVKLTGTQTITGAKYFTGGIFNSPIFSNVSGGLGNAFYTETSSTEPAVYLQSNNSVAALRLSGDTGGRALDIGLGGGSAQIMSNGDFIGSSFSGGSLRLKAYTFATLPASPMQGDSYAITDALAPTYLGTAVGGGTIYAPVVYNGTTWVFH